MTSAPPAVRAGHQDPVAPQVGVQAGHRLPDMLAVGCFILAAVYVTAHFWAHPSGSAWAGNVKDQTLFEWMLANGAWSVTHLSDPFFTDRLGAPYGVNTMANTSALGVAVPLTPVTLIWGATVAYLVMITFFFAATATAWYFVLSRNVVSSRLAAFAGAAFCGFAPGLVSQASGHPHIQGQFLVPIIVWRVFALRDSARPLRAGAILGLIIAYQFFIGEEVLLLTAMACAGCVLAYAGFRRSGLRAQVRPFLTGLAGAGAVALALLVYPLYRQFLDTGSYGTLPWIENFHADLAGYASFSPLSIAGDPSDPVAPLAQNPSELNSFFGWPLLVVAVALVVWLRRELVVRIAATVAVVAAALSLGSEVYVSGRATGVPGAWRPLAGLPVFEAVVATRFGLITTVALGVLVAVAVDRAWASRPAAGAAAGRGWVTVRLPGLPWRRTVRVTGLAWLAAMVAALLPIAPRPLPVVAAPPVPSFFTSGAWHGYVAEDQAVLAVPGNRYGQLAAMRWAAAEGIGFRVVDGYFLAPNRDDPEKTGQLNRVSLLAGRLSAQAHQLNRPQPVTGADRTAAMDELRRAGVAIAAMPADQGNAAAIRATMDALLGPGRQVRDMWIWDVRQR